MEQTTALEQLEEAVHNIDPNTGPTDNFTAVNAQLFKDTVRGILADLVRAAKYLKRVEGIFDVLDSKRVRYRNLFSAFRTASLGDLENPHSRICGYLDEALQGGFLVQADVDELRAEAAL